MIAKSNESQEMYLETILVLSKKLNCVRAVDICEQRKFAKSSVSKALGNLAKKGYIIINETGNIKLTEQGLKQAEFVYYKHEVITNAFIKLGAKVELAEENACRIEHVITDELFELLKSHVENNLKKD